MIPVKSNSKIKKKNVEEIEGRLCECSLAKWFHTSPLEAYVRLAQKAWQTWRFSLQLFLVPTIAQFARDEAFLSNFSTTLSWYSQTVMLLEISRSIAASSHLYAL